METNTSDMEPCEEVSPIDAEERDTANHSTERLNTNLVHKIKRPGAARVRTPRPVMMGASEERYNRKRDITVTSSESEQTTPSSCEQLNIGRKETKVKGMTVAADGQRGALEDSHHGGPSSRPAVRSVKTGNDDQHNYSGSKVKGGRAGKMDAKKSDRSDGQEDYQPHEKSRKKVAVRSVQNWGKSDQKESLRNYSKDRKQSYKINNKDKNNEKMSTKDVKHTDKTNTYEVSSEESSKFISRERSSILGDPECMDERIAKKRGQGIQWDWKNTERVMQSRAVGKRREISRREHEELDESDVTVDMFLKS